MGKLLDLLPNRMKSRVGDIVDSIVGTTDNSAEWEQRLSEIVFENKEKSTNPLEAFFDSRSEGRGIWKWRHYFDIYHRHFSKFIGKEVHVLEVGIYSGGSLDMWKHYFGPRAHIYGLDIEPACKAYEDEQVKVFVGDQADVNFWKDFKRQVPKVDIIIDDGGHQPHQQIATLEEIFPHLSPGGVYLCEDITERGNEFTSYLSTLSDQLNAYAWSQGDSNERRLSVQSTNFQQAVNSIHLYPFVAVIERNLSNVDLVAPKHGTQWQPFLK